MPGNRNTTLGLDRTTGQLSNASTWDTVAQAQFTRETAGHLGELVRQQPKATVQTAEGWTIP